MLKAKFPFKGQKVGATLSISQNSIEISLNVKTSEYRNLFTAEYIENMTAKTGNFKKFKIFSDMILAGFKRQDDTIKVEILTLKDLQKNPDGDDSLDDKLYLILTYSVAFDRVHYPLPLLMEQNIQLDLQARVENAEKVGLEMQDKLNEIEKSRLATLQELSLVYLQFDLDDARE